MFSSNTPFGTGGNFGTGTSFGTGTAFGATQGTGTQFGTGVGSSLFGKTQTGFGGTSFNQPQSSASTGLFGATSTNTGGSLFGGTPSGSIFGQQSTAQPAFSGFGTATGSGLFGNAGQSTTGTSTFATPGQTSTFGSTATSGFGTTVGSSLFGGSANPAGTLFGATQPTTSLFGQSSTVPGFQGLSSAGVANTGTPIKFSVVTSTDAIMKNGVTQNVSTRNQCITVMQQYEGKSIEELRIEDYDAGRKSGATGGTGFAGLSTSTSSGGGGLFGNTGTSGFGSSGFGQKSTTGLGGTSGTLFGNTGTTSVFGQQQQQQQQKTGSLFGQKTGSLFGAPTSGTATTGFGQGFGTGSSLFGQSSSGQTTSLFGSTTTSAPTGLFGTQGTGFGQTQTGTGLFGQTPGFGQTQQQSSLFGGKPFGTTLGTGTVGGIFGGQNKPQTGFSFGNSTGGLGTSPFNASTSTAGGLFGAKPAGFGTATAFGTPTGTGLFGNTGTLGTTAVLGTGTLGTGTFGSLGTQQTAGLGIGGLGSNQNTAAVNALQQQLLEQQLQFLANSPFGDSPLFRNSLMDKSRAEKVSYTTSSSRQRVSTTNSHYKVCARPAPRIKPRPINNHTMNKSKLFEGLEEDSGLSPGTFVPRKNIKKLVIKSKSVTEESPISVIDTTRVKLHPLEGEDDVSVASIPLPLSPPSSQHTSPIMSSTVSKGVISREEPDSRANTSDTMSPIGVKFSQGGVKPSLDTTIADLNVRRVSRTEDDQESLLTSKVTEDGSSENGAGEPCGIVLKRSEYYTIPPLNELNQMVDSNGDVFVDDFIVGRTGYGCVKFHGKTNVAGLNLDEIVFFKRREIEVYPDSYPSKPPVGKDLNKKAEITLEKVWPNDKTLHKPITSPERLKLQGWQKRVEAATAKLGATFLDYDPDNGNWVFTVDHFTRYGMHEYLDEEQLAKKLKRPPLKSNLQEVESSAEKEKLELLKRLQEKKQQFEAYEIEKRRTSLALEDQDSDMADIDHETFPEELLDESAELGGGSDIDEHEMDNSPASHQLATALGMNAQRIQVMKASFFAEQSHPPTVPLSRDGPSVDKSFMSGSFAKGSHAKSSVYPGLMPLGPLLSPKVQRTMDESSSQGQLSQSLFGSPKIGVYPLRQPLVRDTTPTASPSPMLLPSAIGTALDVGIKVVGARNQFGLVPKEDSLVNHKENLVGDVGLMMGRSFRVGWGPGFVLVHCGAPLGSHKKISGNPASQTTRIGGLLSPRPKPNSSASAFSVTVEKLHVASHFSQGKDVVLARHQSVLETEIHHSELSMEDGCPFFQPSTSVEALHNHADVARKYKETTGSEQLRSEAEQACLLWDLMVSLWGNLRETQQDAEELPSTSDDRETYDVCVERKEALSDWLSEAAKAKISQEVDAANFQESDYLKAIFSYLTGKQIRKACQVAQQHNDFRLSLLLSQATGNSLPRNLCYKQLDEWQKLKADMFFNEERIKIYALLAGAMVWPLSRDFARSLSRDESQVMPRDVNVCEGLDWKRVLAVHLWYQCSPTCSIQDALSAYEISFKGSSRGDKYGAPPHPPFVEKLEEDDEEEEEEGDENQLVTRDTCYHLLKLYCKRSHRLERLLSPSTFTAYQLDFSLSWPLYQVLQSLEYTHLSQYHAGLLHSSFAAQLEGLGLWHWAAFVLLHIQDPVRRERSVRSLICRHCPLSADHLNIEKERFMLEDLKIPAEWIHEAKALQARYAGRSREEAFHLVKARHWSLGHNVVLRSLVSDAIINAEYDILKSLLGELEPRDRSSTVKDWATGGQVFLDYLSLVDKFQDIATGKLVPTKYDFEDIHEDVSALCTRINSLPSDTTKDMLCQYDMAKMCANFLKIVIKELTHVTDEGEAVLPTHVIAPQVTRLPMPEDCALAELRQLTPSYISEITAEY
ncbi:nuclear pore complex protein Nup98-Nup96-like isoform X1 [Acropora muricata]|uniref:nuclear pore complex protein Nup98-Nup96-like isoform X1 n=1 Tax=Acropora muricata TaxID=159855 RepID=UPI0034E3FFBF